MRSKKRWEIFFSVATLLGVLLLANVVWQNNHSDDANNATRYTMQRSRSAD